MSYTASETAIKERVNEVNRVNFALRSATQLAIEGVFRFGQDFPVGAVVCSGPFESGRWFASDNRHRLMGIPGWKASHNHAEFMAIGMAALQPHGRPDLIAVNIEPCARCLDHIVAAKIETVAFVVPRSELEGRGLVNKHPGKHIFELTEERQYPITVMQYDDPVIRAANYALLESVKRDLINGDVQIDTLALAQRLKYLGKDL